MRGGLKGVSYCPPNWRGRFVLASCKGGEGRKDTRQNANKWALSMLLGFGMFEKLCIEEKKRKTSVRFRK